MNVDEIENADTQPSLPPAGASPPADAPPNPPPRTPLYEAIATDRPLRRALFVIARKRVPSRDEALDMVSKTYERALWREHHGEPWDPGRRTAQEHMVHMLKSVLKDRRRFVQTHHFVPLLEPQEEELDPARKFDNPFSQDPNAEELLLAREEIERSARIAHAVRERLTAERDDTIAVRMMDAAAEGIEGQANLATHLGCSAKDIEKAQRRITYHARIVIEQYKKRFKKGDPS